MHNLNFQSHDNEERNNSDHKSSTGCALKLKIKGETSNVTAMK